MIIKNEIISTNKLVFIARELLHMPFIRTVHLPSADVSLAFGAQSAQKTGSHISLHTVQCTESMVQNLCTEI